MKCDISTLPKSLNLNVNLHTWWSIQWMIDKITNKDTITSVKKDKWTKIKACQVEQTLYLSLWDDNWAAFSFIGQLLLIGVCFYWDKHEILIITMREF